MPRKKAEPAVESAQAESVVKAAEKSTPKKKESLLEKVTTKKTAAKKAEPKKAAAREEEIYLQSGSEEWNIAECKARAIAAYIAEGHQERSIKKLVIYLKPEEGKAYYVINDNLNGSVDL